MRTEKAAEEQGQVENELLVSGVALRERLLQVHRQRDDFRHGGQSLSKHVNESLVVVVRGSEL